MIERLNTLASFMNVTAAENDLANHLFDFFRKKGFSVEIDCNGCVIVRIIGKSEKRRKLMICAPIDIPGFICLYREDSVSFLTKTSKLTVLDPKSKKLYNNKGEEFSVNESKYDNNEFCINVPKGKIGEVFRSLPYFKKENGFVFGKNACQYILIDLLMNLIQKNPKNDILLCFTTGFYSFGISEANIAFREKADTVLLLGFSEDEDAFPMLYVKNGKNFAQDHLLKEIREIASNLNVRVKDKVSEKEITKEASVISAHFTEVFSLGLPYKKVDESDEKVSVNAVESLGKLLNEFF